MPDLLADGRPSATAGAWAIESGTFTWVFDLRRRRFRRVPPGRSVTGPVLSGPASTDDLAALVKRWRAELRTVEWDGCRTAGSRGWVGAWPRRPFGGRGGRST